MANEDLKLGNNLRFSFASAAVEGDPFSVVFMEGKEALGRPFRFVLTLMADKDTAITYDKMLTETASLKIRAPGAAAAANTPVAYHGALVEFDELEKTDTKAFYRVVLVPRFVRAMADRVSQVYLQSQTIDLTLADILKKIVLPGGSRDLEFVLADKTYEACESVWQYQESTFDFVSRWLEKEGMYYYFDHSGQTEKMIVVDRTVKQPADITEVFYRPAGTTETGSGDQAVQQFTCRRSRLPKQVILQDFNYRAANTPLRLLSDIPGGGVGDVMLYGEDIRSEQQGQRYVKLRAEEIGCGGTLYLGGSTAVGLRSGYFMTMGNNPLPNSPSKFLMTEIEHKGSQASMLLEGLQHPFADLEGEIFYRNTFTAIPDTTQFRPERSTPRPNIAGSMSATVVAEGSGKYADLDDKGRYKVKLPFAVDQNAGTARIRMATPYSGSDHGMDFPLHKDAEVLLSFLNGDPDQPVIMSAAPNSLNPSVVTNARPQISRIFTAGGNSIIMDDTAEKPSILIRAPDANGSVLIGAPVGNAYYSKGNTYSVAMGSSNKVSLGVNNSVSAGTDTGFSISLASKFSMGASLSYSQGQDIKWTSPYSRSTTVDDGTSHSFKDMSIAKVGKLLKMQAGYQGATTEIRVAALKAAKETIRNTIRVITALNVATGAGIATYTGMEDPKASGKQDLTNTNNGIAYFAGQAAVAAISTAASAIGLNLLMKKVVAELEELTYASEMVMDQEGIKLKVATDTLSRTSNYSADGIDIIANEKTLIGTDKFNSLLSLGGKYGAGLAAESQDGLSWIDLRPSGIAELASSESLNIASKSLKLDAVNAALKLADDGSVGLIGRKLEMGFMATGNASLPKLREQIAAAHKDMRATQTLSQMTSSRIKLLTTEKANLPTPPMTVGDFTALGLLEAKIAAERLTLAKYEAELLALAAKKATFEAARALQSAVPDITLHGVSVAQDAVSMKFNVAEIKVAPANVSLAFGSSAIKIGPATIEHSAPLIKIG